jgi:DNA-binding HxlR family transcriptional regulator
LVDRQLRQLERDGVLTRTIHNEIPPRVEYRLTEWGQSLCPALDALLTWIEAAPGDAAMDDGEDATAVA